ncbi:MAG: DUF3267 domain-containing protein [Bacillus sp. (in: firmicutes)]
MYCWKSVTINRQEDMNRILFLSILTMLLSFILLYTIFSFKLNIYIFRDDHVLLFICTLLSLYPAHKALHYLPLLFVYKKLQVRPKSVKYMFLFPLIIKEPISKRYYIFALLTPFFVISSVLIVCIISFFHYAHYFTILLAIHSGICVSDFIILKTVIASPRKSLVEENEDGFEILITER